MSEATNEAGPKPGYKTTEFWLALAATVVSSLYAAGVIPADTVWDKVLGVAAAVLVSLGYSVSRGAAKKNTPFAGPELPDKY